MKDKDKRQMKWTAPAGTIEDNNKTKLAQLRTILKLTSNAV